jgi:membrane-associated phospholipid phosphatase
MRKTFASKLFIVFCTSSLLINIVAAQNTEQRFLEHLTQNRTPGMTHFMQGISNTTMDISYGVPAVFLITGRFIHDGQMIKKSLYVLETVVVSTAIEVAIKHIVNRPRPSTKDSLIIPATDIGSTSFPSGHTSIAFSTATSLSLAYPKWYVIIPSYLWAGTVGFSRMYLGAHYPTDVLAGAIVGSGSALLCRKLNQLLFQHKTEMKKFVWY